MTENEAIKGLMFLKEKLYNGIYADRLDCIDYAISALKNFQQYREIGASPERITELILEGSAAKRILGHHQKIGTVQECREAVEKQKTMKVNEVHVDEYYCPACGSENNCDQGEIWDRYCPNCGQAIAKNLEGLENEG